MPTIDQLEASLAEAKAEKANNSKQLTEAQLQTLTTRISNLQQQIRRQNLKHQNPKKAKAISEKEAAQKRDRRKKNKELGKGKAKEAAAQAKIDKKNERRRENYHNNKNKSKNKMNNNSNNNMERSAGANPPTPMDRIGVTTPASRQFSPGVSNRALQGPPSRVDRLTTSATLSRFSSVDISAMDSEHRDAFFKALDDADNFGARVVAEGQQRRLDGFQNGYQVYLNQSSEEEGKLIQNNQARTEMKLDCILSSAAAKSASRTATPLVTGQGMSSQDRKPAARIDYSNDSNGMSSQDRKPAARIDSSNDSNGKANLNRKFDACSKSPRDQAPQVSKTSQETTPLASSLKRAPGTGDGDLNTQKASSSGSFLSSSNVPKTANAPFEFGKANSNLEFDACTDSSRYQDPQVSKTTPVASSLKVAPPATESGTFSTHPPVPKGPKSPFRFGKGQSIFTFGQQTTGTGDGGLDSQKAPNFDSLGSSSNVPTAPNFDSFGHGGGQATFGKQTTGSFVGGFMSVQQPPTGTGGRGGGCSHHSLHSIPQQEEAALRW